MVKDERLRRLARALFYGSTPALVVDTGGRIVDYNLALEGIFGCLLNGQRFSILEELLDALHPRVMSGSIIPVNNSKQLATECRFDSPDLGAVTISGRTVTCHDHSNDEIIGEIVIWDVIDRPGTESFHERFRGLLDQQLVWDTYAWSYDRILPLMPYYQEVIERHSVFLSSAVEGPIIDLGAGTGNVTERLIFSGRFVTAVDISRAMLEKLCSKPTLGSAVGGRLTILEASAEALPFDDGSYAGVNILLALFDMRSPQAAVRNAVRVLRPEGRIAVTDLKRGFKLDPILQECRRQLRNRGLYEELGADLKRVVSSNRALNPGSRSRMRIEDVFDLLMKEGFEELEIKDSHLGQCATIIGQKPQKRYVSAG